MLTYYSSDYEIGRTFQVMEQMEKIMVMVESMEMIKCSVLEKKKEKKQKAQGKGDINRSSLFLVIKTPSGCDHI